MNAKRAVAPVHHQDGLAIRGDVRQDGFAPGHGAPDDGPRFNVNRQERVVPRCRRVDAVPFRRKIKRVGKWPHGNAGSDPPCEVIGAGI